MKNAKKLPTRNIKTLFDFGDLIRTQNVNTEDFWNYKGSLTTPTCNPIVEWIVMKDNIIVFVPIFGGVS